MDQRVHDMAIKLKMRVVVHPPTDKKHYAKLAYLNPLVTMSPSYPYLKRNRDIVDASELVLAVPKDPVREEFRGSGTWYTIRYANKTETPIIVF